MAVHSKTRQRLRLLFVIVLVLGVLGSVGYVLRKRQVAARILRERDAGYAALQAGEYFTALHKIGPFLQKNPAHVEALFNYATARRHVEEPNGRHLFEAIALHRRLLELDPKHEQGRRQLLDIYLAMRFDPEIDTFTDDVKETSTDDAALRARAIAKGNLGETDEAMRLARAYNALKPSDLRMQMFTASLMFRQGSKPEDIIAHAAQLQAAHPDDPVFELLMSFAYGLAENESESRQWLSKATSRTLEDPEHVQAAIDLLDATGRHDEALAVLVRAAEVEGDLLFRRRVAARLYQSGRFKELTERLAPLDTQIDKADTDLLAHRAMALASLERYEEAERIVAVLAGRSGDFAATGWAGVLAVLPRPGQRPDDARIIAACREALKSRYDNAYMKLWLGDAYNRIGEGEAAAGEWLAAAQRAPAWSAPLLRVLELVGLSGQVAGASELADRAQRLAPADPQALAVAALVKARSDSSQIADVMKLIDEVQRLQSGQPSTLALKVSLLAATGKPDDARKLVESLLQTEPPLPQGAYLSLARAAETHKLDLTARCFERCQQAYGMSRELAAAQARWLLRSDRNADATKAFESALRSSKDGGSLEWQLTWAQVLDQAGDNRAAAAWKELADAYPDDVAIQASVLTSRAAQANRDLVRRAIDRVSSVMGDQGVAWRIADARWIMQGAASHQAPNDRNRDLSRAAGVLNTVTSRYPSQLIARLLLSECLFRLGMRRETVEQLDAAARLAPDSFEIAVQLTSLLQSMGDFEQASEHLERAERILTRAAPAVALQSEDTPTPPLAEPSQLTELVPNPSINAAWRKLVDLYLARGDSAHAQEILSRIDPKGESLAELRARLGQLTDEECRKLLDAPSFSRIELVAERYARAGRPADAEAALALLDKVDAPPGDKLVLRGLYHQRRGDHDKAAQALRAATAEAPTNAKAWRGLIAALLMLGRGDEAIAAATQAAAAVGDAQPFAAVTANQQLVRQLAGTAMFRPLLIALLDPNTDTATPVKALEVIRDGIASGRTLLQVSTELRRLADGAPALAALQYFMVDLYLPMGYFDDAYEVASRLMRRLPADPAPAGRTAEVLAAADRWSQVILIAEEWRRRLGGAAAPADRLLAAAFLQTGDPNSAARHLAPYLPQIAKDPVGWSNALMIYSQALIALGRLDEAESLLRPTLPAGLEPRGIWMQLASSAIRDGDAAARWLQHVETVIPENALAERVALAESWLRLAIRTTQPAQLEAADAHIRQLTMLLASAADSNADQWTALAILKEQRADPTGAAEAYRRALALKPDHSLACNNLAMLVIKQNGNLKEAEKLAATAAADQNSPVRYEFLDTLARVQAKANQLDVAEKSIREAVALQPSSVPKRELLVNILIKAKKAPEARQEFSELDWLAARSALSDASLAARLAAQRTAIQNLDNK